MTRVSVVMGVFNGADLLETTIDSVLRQDFGDYEFIIVDDGSDDPRVGGLLQRYAARDARICVRSKRNEGLTRALIDGCALGGGRYIARIDAGDIMLPGRLAAQVDVLDRYPGCAFVSCRTEFCGPRWELLWRADGAPRSRQPVRILPESPDQGLLGNVPHHGSTMFRRSAYRAAGGYRPAFYYGQDWDLWYRLAELGDYYVVPETLYRARFFPGSISLTRMHQQNEAACCSRGAFVARRRGLDESGWLERAAAARFLSAGSGAPFAPANHEPGFYFIGEALRRRGDPRARHYLARAMRAAPGSPRAYLRWLQSWLPRDRRAA